MKKMAFLTLIIISTTTWASNLPLVAVCSGKHPVTKKRSMIQIFEKFKKGEGELRIGSAYDLKGEPYPVHLVHKDDYVFFETKDGDRFQLKGEVSFRGADTVRNVKFESNEDLISESVFECAYKI
ncbi:MAG: hypothetical protein AB7I27_11670 [Bacteriovoracaceae bacterium]